MKSQSTSATQIALSVLAVLSLLALPKDTSPIAKIEAEDTPPVPINHFENITLEAKAAFVFDVNTGKSLYAHRESDILPLASITKIMTAATALELAPKSTEVSVMLEHLEEYGESGLYPGERWTLENLLRYMLVISSNDGAAAVAGVFQPQHEIQEHYHDYFVERMNQKARALGYGSFTFYNPTGLDESETQNGGYGSAKDVASLLSYSITRYRDVFEPTRYPTFTVTSLDGFAHTIPNTDIIAHAIPGLIAGKTGYTPLAGGNLAIAFDAGIQRPIIVVVLGSSITGRFDDVQKLVEATQKTISQAK